MHAFDGTPPIALCDAGVIMARLPTWFDPNDSDACATCSDLFRRAGGTA